MGILTIKVRAEGGGKHLGAPPEAIEWKVQNSGQFSMRVRALLPTVDPSLENQQAAAAMGAEVDRAMTENDEEYMDQWQEKEDACNGNEACENNVIAQKMADPRFQRIMQKAQGAMPAFLEAGRAVDFTPSFQIWTTDQLKDAPLGRGEMQVDLTETKYGVLDVDGRYDVSCRWTGKMAISQGLGGTMMIDGKASRYELRLPVDDLGIELTESCGNKKSGSSGPYEAFPSKNKRYVYLIGAFPPKGVKDIEQLLTVKGPVGSARSPQIGGKHTTTTDLVGEGPPVPVKVTIEWQFAAGGR